MNSARSPTHWRATRARTRKLPGPCARKRLGLRRFVLASKRLRSVAAGCALRGRAPKDRTNWSTFPQNSRHRSNAARADQPAPIAPRNTPRRSRSYSARDKVCGWRPRSAANTRHKRPAEIIHDASGTGGGQLCHARRMMTDRRGISAAPRQAERRRCDRPRRRGSLARASR